MHKLIRVMEPQKHLLVAVGICLLLIINTIYTSQIVDDVLVQRSYNNTDSMVIQMSKDVYTNFSNAQSQIQLITQLATNKNFHSHQDMQDFLDELVPNDHLVSYSILLPDGTLLQRNDSININMPPQDYATLFRKGTFISPILTGDDGRKYIAIGMHFLINTKDTGIFYGLLNLNQLKNFLNLRNIAETTDIALINGMTGDMLIDTFTNTNINIRESHSATCAVIKGRTFEEMLSDMQNNYAGHSTYDCQINHTYIYSSYYPVGLFNLVLQVKTPEDAVLTSFGTLRNTIHIYALVQSLLCCFAIAYLFYINIKRRRRYHAALEKSKFFYDMQSHLLGTSSSKAPIKEVLSQVRDYVQADMIHFAIMDGKDRKDFFCYPLEHHSAIKAMGKEAYTNAAQLLKGHRSLYLNEIKTEEFLKNHMLTPLASLDIKNMFLVAERNNRDELVGFLSIVNIKQIDGYEEMLENIADNLQLAIQNVEAYSLLQKLGNSDELTGLKNRNAYEQALNGYESSSQRYCCIYADANGLHDLNNTYGHEAGDKMLITVATAMKTAFGANDTYRIGGDEFISFTTGMTPDEVQTAVERIKADLAQQDYHASIGWSFQNENQFLRYTISLAEKAMYRDKELYYQNVNKTGKIRNKNQHTENLLLEKSDRDFFLRTIASNYVGVYIVNLATDDTRVIFRPNYFDPILRDNNFLFRNSIRQFAETFMEPSSWPDFRICYDFKAIEQRFKENKRIELTYKRIDGVRVGLRILPADDYSDTKKNTLWIFEAIPD